MPPKSSSKSHRPRASPLYELLLPVSQPYPVQAESQASGSINPSIQSSSLVNSGQKRKWPHLSDQYEDLSTGHLHLPITRVVAHTYTDFTVSLDQEPARSSRTQRTSTVFRETTSPTKAGPQSHLSGLSGSGSFTAFVPPSYDPSPEVLDPLALFEVNLSPHEEYVLEKVVEVVPAAPKRQREKPMDVWKDNRRKEFLEELLRLEGCDSGSACMNRGCLTGETPRYRCRNCLSGVLLCRLCMRDHHLYCPIHNIEVWNGTYFSRTSLREIGVTIQLGHPPGQQCSNPHILHPEFVIIDTNGQHTVSLHYCNCELARNSILSQLLRFGLYPATTLCPRTASTFALLKTYFHLTFQSKILCFDFYYAIMKLTDNSGLVAPPDRYEDLLIMTRQWLDLTTLKRAGRGHFKHGIVSTKPGELAVLCPACPHVGINLPIGWESIPLHRGGWLFTLYRGADGNFKLKRKDISSLKADPPLNKGCAFFVEPVAYQSFLASYNPDNLSVENLPSNCRAHDAVEGSELRKNTGLASTSVVAVDDIRHDMKLPNSMADLEKGERYRTVDYVVWSHLQNHGLKRIILSYDVCCQWSINLLKRFPLLPLAIRQKINLLLWVMRYVVPKWHLTAHVDQCRLDFSFSRTPFTGRTDGKGVERGWSFLNLVAKITREMSPGSRWDIIDGHCNAWNWKKVTLLAESLLQRLKAAVPEARKHAELHTSLTEALPEEDVQLWTKAVELWEHNDSHPKTQSNPYEVTQKEQSEEQIRFLLNQEEARAIKAGELLIIHEKVTSLDFLAKGLELKDAQTQLLNDSLRLGPHSTQKQLDNVLKSDKSLRNKIDLWIKHQRIYCPAAAVHREQVQASQPIGSPQPPTHAIPLLLPSSTAIHGLYSKELQEHELRLWIGRCNDSLDNV